MYLYAISVRKLLLAVSNDSCSYLEILKERSDLLNSLSKMWINCGDGVSGFGLRVGWLDILVDTITAKRGRTGGIRSQKKIVSNFQKREHFESRRRRYLCLLTRYLVASYRDYLLNHLMAGINPRRLDCIRSANIMTSLYVLYRLSRLGGTIMKGEREGALGPQLDVSYAKCAKSQ